MKMIPKLKSKEKQEVLPKRYNQKMYNRIFLGGFIFFLFLCVGTIATNLMKNVAPKEPVQIVKETGEQVDYRLQNYLNTFVYYYFNFSEDYKTQETQSERLTAFYVEGLSIKSQGLVRQPSTLLSSRLIDVTDTEATYLVKYSVLNKKEKKTEKKEVITEFHIPYKKKDVRYYVSDFPYFTPVQSNQVDTFSEKEVFRFETDNVSNDDSYQSLTEFLKLFFANYVSSQENLDLISKDVPVLTGTTFKTIDWTYVEDSEKGLRVYVQVTLETGGNDRAEHFTFELMPKEESFFVEKFYHGIQKK